MASTASAAISSVTLDKTNMTVTQGEVATFTVTVKNDNKSSAQGTTFRNKDIENSLSNSFTFNPAVLNLSKNQTVQTVLSINTQLLSLGTYKFIVRLTLDPHLNQKGQNEMGIIHNQIINGLVT